MIAHCGDKHQHVQLKTPRCAWEAISGNSAGWSIANMIISIQGMQVILWMGSMHMQSLFSIPDEVAKLSIPGQERST